MVAVGAVIEQSRSAYDYVAIAASTFANDINFHVEASLSVTFKLTALIISGTVYLYNHWRAIEYGIGSMEMQPADIML